MIDAADLSLSFGSVRALDGLSFDVRKGELFGVVGADGAGKTSLLRVLAGLIPQSEGRVTVAGCDMRTDSDNARKHLAYMPQKFGLYQDLTVEENIDFYADLFLVRGEERDVRKQRLFEFSGLGEFSDRLAGKLSGGMKQKLGLSCALVHHPELLLLDEPTFGVDPISRRDLWIIIHEMVAEGITVLVSTSYLDEAERFDRVMMLSEGALSGLDSPEALKRSIAGRLVAISQSGDAPRVLRDRLLQRSDVSAAYLFGDRLHVLLDDASAGGLEVEGARLEYDPIAPSLEDVFMCGESATRV